MAAGSPSTSRGRRSPNRRLPVSTVSAVSTLRQVFPRYTPLPVGNSTCERRRGLEMAGMAGIAMRLDGLVLC
jgi:hypothetical protein